MDVFNVLLTASLIIPLVIPEFLRESFVSNTLEVGDIYTYILP